MRFHAFCRRALFFTWFNMFLFTIAESAFDENKAGFRFAQRLPSHSPIRASGNHDQGTSLLHSKDNDDIDNKPSRGYDPNLDEFPLDKPIITPVGQNVSDLSTKEGIDIHLEALRSRISPKTFELLTTDILSEPDPFQYLINKTKNIYYRDMPKITSELRFVLNSNAIPESYVPYVQALRSVLSGKIALQAAKHSILEIQKKKSSTNLNKRFSIPSDISSPPELSHSGLFSSEILADPDPPIRLLNKLLHISKSDIPNLINCLENFETRVHKLNMYLRQEYRPYIWYGNSLISFFKSESYLDDLKRDMENLRRISTDAKSGFTNNENEIGGDEIN